MADDQRSRIFDARQCLEKAESSLKAILGEAVQSGDYESVLTLSGWARELAAIGNPERDAFAIKRHAVVNGTPKRASPPARRKKAKRSKSRAGSTNPEYPKFLRRIDDLVKTGWSKRSQEEYEHKSPYRLVALVADSLARAAKQSDLVAAPNLLPIKDPAAGTEVPAYQVYLTIAWLRSIGLVQQQGRQGYVITDAGKLVARVSEAWDKLGTSRG